MLLIRGEVNVIVVLQETGPQLFEIHWYYKEQQNHDCDHKILGGMISTLIGYILAVIIYMTVEIYNRLERIESTATHEAHS